MTKQEWKVEAIPSVLQLLAKQVKQNQQFYECYHKWHMTASDEFFDRNVVVVSELYLHNEIGYKFAF
jgi:hypothetical protein